ncbi:MAG: T9SS type A sorting domain-containing protein [Flavobacteriales bacterium]|nr:T9SS type A sorting domain-containing protein [Flavobacteriales bacterium]
MKKLSFLLLIAFVGLNLHAQRFTVDRHNISDTLWKKGYVDHEIFLDNKAAAPLVMKLRVITNTIDTNNWGVTFCTYPLCVEGIPYEVQCDTIYQGETGMMINSLSIDPKDTPKDCEFSFEMFDVLDSTQRDTIKYTFVGVDREKYLGVQQISHSNSLSIYPNPAKGKLYVENSDLNSNIKVIDLTGKVTLELSPKTPESKSMLDLSNIEKGMYFIQITNKMGLVESRRILVE